MRRISYTPYVMLAIALFFLLSLPSSLTRSARHMAVATLSPSWRAVHAIKQGAMYLCTLPTVRSGSDEEMKKQIEEIYRENQTLHGQVESMRQWLLCEDRIEEQLIRLKQLGIKAEEDPSWRDYYTKRSEQIARLLELQSQALSAKVIFREPALWSSFVWVNIGEKHNKLLGKMVVAKNSPVVVGNSLVGIVEEVRGSQSKVRLITDASLVPAVRAYRGQQQNTYLWQQLESVLYQLEERKDLFDSLEEKQYFLAFVNKLKVKMEHVGIDRYLAKGELYGNSMPLWRARRSTLHGVGFNYDWADSEGPARDLRSGKPLTNLNSLESLSILQEGDLLVTSGLDGIFPPGLHVATVSKVENLKEGSCSYDIEAHMTAGDLNELTTVYVLPPLDFELP